MNESQAFDYLEQHYQQLWEDLNSEQQPIDYEPDDNHDGFYDD